VRILLLIFLLLPVKGLSQIQDSYNNNWIIQISEFRDHLLRKNPDAVHELKSLLNKWENLETTKSEREKMTFNILISSQINKNSSKIIKKQALKYMPESAISNNLSKSDIEIICKNSELLDLIHLGLLMPNYPFSINSNSSIFDELLIYNIKANDKIGDIGCGTGMIGVLLNKIEPKSQIYLNELNAAFLKYISLRISNDEINYDSKNFSLVKGTKKSTNFEELELDKIILRNTFHHVKKKVHILNSIKRSLGENGELFILESVKEFDTDNDICKDAMNSKNSLAKIITENGFDLIEEHKLGERVLLKFQISKNKKCLDKRRRNFIFRAAYSTGQ